MSILYLVILVLLVLFSWIGSACGLMLPDGMHLPNLLGADSVRYFVRHSIDHISASPLVEVILLLLMISAVVQSGLWSSLVETLRERTLPTLSRRQVYSLRVSLVIFVVCLLIIAMGFVGPQGNLLSVTGRIAGGPFAQGWLPLLSLCVCLPCICYGWLSGMWSTERDILSALTVTIARRSSYFVTLIIASQVMAAIRYLHLFELLGWGDMASSVCYLLLSGLPLLIVPRGKTRAPHQ